MFKNPPRLSPAVWALLLSGVLGVLLLVVWVFRSVEILPNRTRSAEERMTRNEYLEVGGVRRPVTDIRRPGSHKIGKSDESILKTVLPPKPIGNIDHPQVASVVEAMKSGTHPERLSALVPPKVFDKAAYEADAKAYLSVVEPGRVWQVA